MSSSSSWLAAYQKAVDTATSQTKSFREYIAEKQASLVTLEEASKQLKDTMSTVTTAVAQTAQRASASAAATTTAGTNTRTDILEREIAREMEEYGITDEYVEAVRSKLEYGIFRDFNLPGRGGVGGADDDKWLLNAWQERHVILLMQRVKEVDALRYALCPKYMDDGVFWAIYFELVRKMLPVEAFEYKEGGRVELPRRYEEVVQEQAPKNPGRFDYLESRFREMRKMGERVIGDHLRVPGAASDNTPGKTSQEHPLDAREQRAARSREDDTSKAVKDTTTTSHLVGDVEDDVDDDVDATLEEYLRDAEVGDDLGEGEPLDDEELDAYLDTLALSSDDGNGSDKNGDDNL